MTLKGRRNPDQLLQGHRALIGASSTSPLDEACSVRMNTLIHFCTLYTGPLITTTSSELLLPPPEVVLLQPGTCLETLHLSDPKLTMTHLSPAVFGVWSVSSALVRLHPLRCPPSEVLICSFSQLTAFCFYHVWHYDRFRCLRLNYGPYSGEFKRLMAVRSHLSGSGFQTERSSQYTYILTLPLITTYSVGNAVIKYREGFVFDTQFGGERI